MHLLRLQQTHSEWAKRNFPNAVSNDALLGVVEEVGELAHAVLKRKQGIRGTAQEHHAEIIDAVGDIVMYLTHFCTLEGIDLEHAVNTVLETIQKRDWIKYQKNGVSE